MKKSLLILSSTLLLSQASQAGVQDLIKRFEPAIDLNIAPQLKKDEFKHPLELIIPEKKSRGEAIVTPLKDNDVRSFRSKVMYFKNFVGEPGKMKVAFSKAAPEVHVFELEKGCRFAEESRKHATKTKEIDFFPTLSPVSALEAETLIYSGQIELIANDLKRPSADYLRSLRKLVGDYNCAPTNSEKGLTIFKFLNRDFFKSFGDKARSEQALDEHLTEGFIEDMVEEAGKLTSFPVDSTLMLPLIKCGDYVAGLNAARDLTDLENDSDRSTTARLLKFFGASSLDLLQGKDVSFIVTDQEAEYPAALVAQLQGDENYQAIDPTATVMLPIARIVYDDRQPETENAEQPNTVEKESKPVVVDQSNFVEEESDSEDEYTYGESIAEELEKEVSPEEKADVKEREAKLRQLLLGK